MNAPRSVDEVGKARLLLVALAFAWGLNWPAIKIGLEGFSPWTYRLTGFTISALSLVVLVKLQGLSLKPPRDLRTWQHIVVSSTLNIVAFGLFSTFAQLTASTSRVAIVTYSFPIWATLLAWLVLGERLTRRGAVGLALCICGLAVLLYPVLHSQALIGLLLSVACAMTWAVGTIYLKLTRFRADLTLTTWQLVFAALTMLVCVPFFHGIPSFELAGWRPLVAVLFSGVIGTGIAYVMWYSIVAWLPAATAALGTLAVPVVGVVSSALILGERPGIADIVGFACIFAAAACVILQPRDRRRAQPSDRRAS